MVATVLDDPDVLAESPIRYSLFHELHPGRDR